MLRMINFIFVLFTFSVYAVPQEVIYGEDNRLDLYEVNNSLHLSLADSTAAMISNSRLTFNSDTNSYSLTGKTFKASKGLCSDERFGEQITLAVCSGFLVAPDLLVTAGHCIKNESDCLSYKWVFGFHVNKKNSEATIELGFDNVYSCKEIIERSYNNNKNDHALIRLEREVVSREPLNFRREGKISSNTPLVVIGHPSGLPTKIADGANIRSNDHSVYFRANLDTYGGNSGSAVFDDETGLVEGILVRGETDFVYDSVSGCRRSNKCENNACRGEDITRITNIEYLKSL